MTRVVEAAGIASLIASANYLKATLEAVAAGYPKVKIDDLLP